jgi:hypothetical protein
MNDTLSREWVPEPDGRGTWNILSTCILTIILCAGHLYLQICLPNRTVHLGNGDTNSTLPVLRYSDLSFY